MLTHTFNFLQSTKKIGFIVDHAFFFPWNNQKEEGNTVDWVSCARYMTYAPISQALLKFLHSERKTNHWTRGYPSSAAN